MMPSQQQENAKTLAALLGIDEDEATELLSASALVSYSMSDNFSRRTGIYVLAMLSKTINRAETSVHQLPKPDVEVVIGQISPQTCARKIWVNFSKTEISIAPNQICVEGQGSPHDIFGLLAACHACAITLKAILGDRLTRLGSRPIVIKPGELLG